MKALVQKLLFSRATKALCAIYLVWAGLILGVSFIATPVKFQAPHLSLAVALEVGKVTFHLFNKLEWMLLGWSLFLTKLSAARGMPWRTNLILLGLLFGQTFWLLPALDQRLEVIVNGGEVDPSYYHWGYVGAEVTKLLLLFRSAWSMLQQRTE
ncbi:hypothetical protein [Candidatus Odyssella thessalonicensis]|uniref:hypothetical protein n=1 Tax=Candidatus Odyssella thessalonicensis TaxID=84647 RepID=UPI000225B4C5|nr:hypothetical protein [Candidatus Odyssella thessalonicensis]